MAVLKVSQADILRYEREMGRRSLAWFIRHAWHLVEQNPYQHNWHIDVICAHLEAVTRGEIRNLILNIPPGSMKSLSVSVFWSAWMWIINPTLAQLYSSFDGELTARDAKRVKDIITSPWFQARWGDRVRLDPDEAVRDFNVFNRAGTKTGGWRFSTSVGGKTTGRHPDVRVIDDPTKPKDVTPDNLKSTIEWWQNTMVSRARDQSTVATVLIMQRLAENDLAGYFIEQGGWVVVNIPLEYVPEEAFNTAWGKDPRTEKGQSFWYGRYGDAVIATIKKNTPDVAIYSAQWQQNPTPGSGIIFEKGWIRRWTQLPDSGIWIQSWDFAFKGENTSDYVCGGVWFWAKPNAYLVDRFWKKVDFKGSVAAIKEMSARWPMAITKLIEDKANGTAIINTLETELVGILPVKLGSDSKTSRARAVQPMVSQGHLHIPADAAWAFEYEGEMVSFPKGKNDDQVDMTTQLLNHVATMEGLDLAAAMQGASAMGFR